MDGISQSPAGGDPLAVVPVPEPAPAGPSPRRLRLFGALAFAITAILSTAIPAYTFRLHQADLSVPLVYAHDSFPIMCWVKTITVEGWWTTTDRCGAP